jgi:predicted nucleic acid-binding protein
MTGGGRTGDALIPDPHPLLSGTVCFDTMVPMYMAISNRSQLLREVFEGRAVIPGAVERELRGLNRSHPEIGQVLVPCFARVITLDRAQAMRASDRQRSWKGAEVINARPNQDRGEAECVELCVANDWPLVSQDSDAIRAGRTAKKRVPVFAAPDVLLVMAAHGRLLAVNAWKIYQSMLEAGLEKARYWQDEDAEARFVGAAARLRAEAA